MSIPVSKKIKKFLKNFTKYLTTQKLCGRILVRLNKKQTRITQITKQGEAEF